MHVEYKTSGTCSQRIVFDLEDGVVRGVRFEGGCHGNLQGVSRLVEGMTVEEIEEKLSGIRCGFKPTSCPDQLARAVRAAAAKQKSSSK